jgi:hypothetical protein
VYGGALGTPSLPCFAPLINSPVATFAVCQSQPDGTVKVLYQGLTLAVAESEADRINAGLASAGIPSAVSSAFVL